MPYQTAIEEQQLETKHVPSSGFIIPLCVQANGNSDDP